MRPRKIDKDACLVDCGHTRLAPFVYMPVVKEKKCDWEYNPMIGMEECNSCGMTR
jgi:hypothetical protein